MNVLKVLSYRAYMKGMSDGVGAGRLDEQDRVVRSVLKLRDQQCVCDDTEICEWCQELNLLVASIRETDDFPDELDYKFGMKQENERVSYLIESNASTIAKNFNGRNTADAVARLLDLIGEAADVE